MAEQEELHDQRDLLTIRPVPRFLSGQLDKFTQENLRARVARKFDASSTLDALRENEGQRIIAVDIGGDKLSVVTFQIHHGLLVQDEQESASVQSTSGFDYLPLLEYAAGRAAQHSIPVGVSFAGPVDGTTPTAYPNVQVFGAELVAKYGGDFANLFPTLHAFDNDAVTGAIAGAVEAHRHYPEGKAMIYIINGSGFGGAILKDGVIIATEPGHQEVVGALNRFGQNKPCGVLSDDYVCIERIAASKAGIEDLWAKLAMAPMDGRQISKQYLLGDSLATDLYDNSAQLTAHAVRGMANAFDLFREQSDTTVVFHGGAMKVVGYGSRVIQILQKDLGWKPTMVLTHNFSSNACSDGAALAALSAS